MREYVLVFVGSVLLAAASFWIWPREGECKGDCPPYNSRCISSIQCGYNCGMICVDTPGYGKRCR